MVDAYFGRFVLPEDLHAALQKCRSIAYIETQEELDELVFGPTHSSRYDVVYNIVRLSLLKSPPGDDGLVVQSARDHAALQGGRPGARV